MGLLDKLFNSDKKDLAAIEKAVRPVESYAQKMHDMEDEELQEMTQKFRDRLAAGKRWTISCPRLSRSRVKQPSVSSGNTRISVSSKAPMSCTAVISPK